MKTKLLPFLLGFAAPLLVRAADAPPVYTPPPADSILVTAPESAAAKEKRLEWFRHDKFGLFIHWGLYCIPAGYWKGERSPGIGEWIMNRMKIPAPEYAQLAMQFNPVLFDADAWAQLAEDAGMKYVVITSKHHDGFAMFHSAVSPYNVYDATPFHRDVVKELAAACARHGLRFGVYYSQSQDWHEPGGTGNNWDFPTNEEKDKSGAYDHYLQTKAEPQLRELLTNYGPLCLIWFDTPQMMTGDRPKRLTDLVRKLQPDALIDGRLGAVGDYRGTGDNVIPPTASDDAWETPATLNRTWGFRSDDTDWKSPSELVFKLMDIASKGGNYLLNVGPQANGLIPQASQDNLRAVGRWLKLNGEALYGTGHSPFGDEFGEYSAKFKTHDGKPVFLARTDWRCTTKPGKLYFTVFHLERDGQLGYLALPSFKNTIKSAYVLDEAHTPLVVKTAADGTRYLNPPRYLNDTMGAVIVVEIEGDKVVL